MGWKTQFSFRLDFKCSNNQIEYGVLIIVFKILREIGVSTIEFIETHY